MILVITTYQAAMAEEVDVLVAERADVGVRYARPLPVATDDVVMMSDRSPGSAVASNNRRRRRWQLKKTTTSSRPVFFQGSVGEYVGGRPGQAAGGRLIISW